MNERMMIDAERLSKSGGTPAFRKSGYEDAMLDLAKAEAKPGEGVACAFARLVDEDPRMAKLYDAGQAADLAEVRKGDHEERELLAKHREEMWPLMVKVARDRALDGETVEQALDRLLCTDPLFKRAYASMA